MRSPNSPSHTLSPKEHVVPATPYFTSETFRFLKELKAHNDRAWFNANKGRYEDHVKVPSLRFIQDFAPYLKKLSPHFNAGPRSLFRIYRDVRFSKDKSPFKTHLGIQFRHDRGRDVHAPGYYFHIEPGQCFTGLGLWHPDGRTLRAIRELIVEQPALWKKATRVRRFTSVLELGGDSITRAPRGFDAEHPCVEDLMRKDFIGGASISEELVTSAHLPRELAKIYAAGTLLMEFLCKAVGVRF
jgi:uncharacterized protein (TIGR02453 family)